MSFLEESGDTESRGTLIIAMPVFLTLAGFITGIVCGIVKLKLVS